MVSSPTPYLDKYTINLSEKVAKNPDKFQAFERENITQRVLISLVKQIQNSPLLVGLPGVGKTAIIEDLARQLLNTKNPFLKGKRITQISLANLMNASNGELFAYKLQKIIDELIANRETIIAFIDEIHQIVGTGASNSGSALDAGNILKPALSRDDLQIIGATTTKEFHDYIARDGALMRRFDVVEVPELSYHQTAKLLPKIGPRLNNSIDVPDDIYEKIMQFSQRYITDRYFPEKAIMLLDSALGAAKVNQHAILTVHDVAHIIQADYSIPEHVIHQTTDDRFQNPYETLKAHVIGQDDQINKLVRKLINRAAGLADTSKPESFLFMGPTGVGKTELSKQLAISLFGAEENLIRFDMSEFKFAGTSLARFKTKLTTQVRHTPYAVLLLDEIEKADPEIMDLLLQVLDDGRLSDDYGRVINFKDLIIIMTTNSGAKAIMNREAKSDEVKNDPKRQANFEEQLELALQGDGYRPEFIARIGAILVFNVLKMPDVVRIVNLKLSQISRKAKQQGFKLIFTIDEVTRRIPSFDLGYEYVDGVRVPSSTAAEYLANEGYKPSRGVRPLDDVIATYVSDPVAEVIMTKRKGDFPDFDTFVFRALGNPPTNSPYGDWQIVFSTMKEGDNEFIS